MMRWTTEPCIDFSLFYTFVAGYVHYAWRRLYWKIQHTAQSSVHSTKRTESLTFKKLQKMPIACQFMILHEIEETNSIFIFALNCLTLVSCPWKWWHLCISGVYVILGKFYTILVALANFAGGVQMCKMQNTAQSPVHSATEHNHGLSKGPQEMPKACLFSIGAWFTKLPFSLHGAFLYDHFCLELCYTFFHLHHFHSKHFG